MRFKRTGLLVFVEVDCRYWGWDGKRTRRSKPPHVHDHLKEHDNRFVNDFNCLHAIFTGIMEQTFSRL